MFFGKDNSEAVKTEARDVMILKFGKDAGGDIVTAEGALVPNEVGVQVDSKIVGRAVLHTREDGIHADIMLEKGSLKGMTASAIVSAKSFEVLPLEGRKINQYEIIGVGLTPTINVQKTEPQTEQEPGV